MSRTWQLQEAKNRLSEVVVAAQAGEPQVITRRGQEAAVVLSVEAWRALTRRKGGLVAFLRRSPLAGVELDLERSQDPGREVSL
jgi:prevent-host-death family protein